jgi:pyrroline-5-carboxylate reductase
MERERKLGVIGLGNMGTALVSGALRSGVLSPREIIGYDREHGKCEIAASRYSIEQAASAAEVLATADAVLIAVKPQNFDELVAQVPAKSFDGLVISICAGIGLERLRASFPRARVVRVMPNTPALVGEGMSAIAFGPGVPGADRHFVFSLFQGVGKTIEVSDDDMDAVTALSGSGPAYFFRFVKNLVEAGVEVGLPAETAFTLAIQTGFGALMLAKESSVSLDDLIKQVSSPGGTTVAGLAELDAGGFDDAIRAGVRAAYRRSRELGGKE